MTELINVKLETYLQMDDMNTIQAFLHACERMIPIVVTEAVEDSEGRIILGRSTVSTGAIFVPYNKDADDSSDEIKNERRKAETEAVVDLLAKGCHELNRIVSAYLGEVQPSWEEAPEEHKISSLKTVAYRLNHPDATDESMHVEWCTQKLADGWEYGPIKSNENKTHPCLVPYSQLPEGQRLKDRLLSFFLGQQQALINTITRA